MFAATFPDWKKIGWHVGKRLKDILSPPKDTGPSREERRIQRLQDALDGFVYFDNFDEVEMWRRERVYPIQVSNTPLLKRSAPGVHDQRTSSTSILLCHDYSGGYHDYESVRPAALEHKYFGCDYLRYVDTFVYFSHKLVCVPPPTWTNTLHRNGVKILGTFLIERHTAQIERLLEGKNDTFTVANHLAAMADAYGFDGWLLNIEGEFPSHIKDYLKKLTGFISTLKHLLRPLGKVVWYDALTCDNEVEYQNSLSSKNLVYALAADSLFTNYKWTVAKVEESRRIAETQNMETANICFGVDVWAQNTNMSGPRRVTFPSKGGGGTNTGVALSVLSDRGFSTAVFGPAWTHEHFSTSSVSGPSEAELVQRSMWEGWPLPAELSCDCRQGEPHHTSLYQGNPILAYAHEYPVGSETYLETDFQEAFERTGTEGKGGFRSKLGSQAILPNCSPMTASQWKKASTQPAVRILYGELSESPLGGLAIHTRLLGKRSGAQDPITSFQEEEIFRLCLFKLNMYADGSLKAHIVHKGMTTSTKAKMGIYCAYQSPSSNSLEYHQSPLKSYTVDLMDSVIDIKYESTNARLVELGFYCSSLLESLQPEILCQIQNITVRPKEESRASIRTWRIVNLSVIERGHSEKRQKMLAWELSELNHGAPEPLDGLPWSKTTGPFAYFIVFLQGQELGRAYCTEFCLREEDFGGNTEDHEGVEAEVVVRGLLFGGGEINSDPVKLSLDWVIL